MIQTMPNRKVGEPNAVRQQRATGHSEVITPGGVSGRKDLLHLCVVCGDPFPKDKLFGPWSLYCGERCQVEAARLRVVQAHENQVAAEVFVLRLLPFLRLLMAHMPEVAAALEEWDASTRYPKAAV